VREEPRIRYLRFKNDLASVTVDGDFVGYISPDADGWAFWTPLEGDMVRYQLAAIAATRGQAVREGLGLVAEHK
jgi:hypothetical protein